MVKQRKYYNGKQTEKISKEKKNTTQQENKRIKRKKTTKEKQKEMQTGKENQPGERDTCPHTRQVSVGPPGKSQVGW